MAKIQDFFSNRAHQIDLPPGEYAGPLTINHSCTVDGHGATLWAKIGAPLIIDSSNVTIKNLRVELTNKTSDFIAIYVTGKNVHLENVEVYGNIRGLQGVSDNWNLPRTINLGTFAANERNEFLLKLNVGESCQIINSVYGLKTNPQILTVGENDVLLTVDMMRDGMILYGDLILETANKILRRIYISGRAQNGVAVKRVSMPVSSPQYEQNNSAKTTNQSSKQNNSPATNQPFRRNNSPATNQPSRRNNSSATNQSSGQNNSAATNQPSERNNSPATNQSSERNNSATTNQSSKQNNSPTTNQPFRQNNSPATNQPFRQNNSAKTTNQPSRRNNSPATNQPFRQNNSANIVQKGQRVLVSGTENFKVAFKSARLPVGMSIDAYAFCLGENKLIARDEDMVFFNNPRHYSFGVYLDSKVADTSVCLSLNDIPEEIKSVVVCFAIYDDGNRSSNNFSKVSSPEVIVSADGNICYEFPLQLNQQKAFTALEIYRSKGSWKINFIGAGFNDGLRRLCEFYGADVI